MKYWVNAIFLLGLGFSSAILAAPTRDLTIMVYAAGDEIEIEEQTAAGLQMLIHSPHLVNNEQVKIVVLHDKTGDQTGQPSIFRNETVDGKVRFVPIAETEIAKALGIKKFTWPEWNTGSASTLKTLWTVAVRLYPALHYYGNIWSHSWGQRGLAQDFFYDGKEWDLSSLIKNYEVRRAAQEVIRENRALIPKGKFDGLYIDACDWAQLDILLEVKDEFEYVVASPLQTPFYSHPYDQILDVFLPKLKAWRARLPENVDPKVADASFAKVFEEHFLKTAVEKYIVAHGPVDGKGGGSLTLLEKEADSVTLVAVRTSKLQAVADALKKFIAAVPASVTERIQAGKRSEDERVKDDVEPYAWLERVVDVDEEMDMVEFARRFAKYGPAQSRAAAAALEKSLGYRAPDPTVEPTPLTHPKAQGAWAHVDIDPVAKVDISVCMGLQALDWLTEDTSVELPVFKKGRKLVRIRDIRCPDYESELDDHARTKLRSRKRNKVRDKHLVEGELTRYEDLFDMRVSFPHGVSAYVKETRAENAKEGEVARRTLSIWFPKGEKARLNLKPVLRFVGTTQMKIDYLLEGDPKKYIEEAEGKAESVSLKNLPAYKVNLDDRFFTVDGEPGPIVAEGHSNNTYRKHGFGILFERHMTPEDQYANGRLPLEIVERMERKAMTLETYDKFFEAVTQAGNEKKYMRAGYDFYKLNRIVETGWDKFLGLK